MGGQGRIFLGELTFSRKPSIIKAIYQTGLHESGVSDLKNQGNLSVWFAVISTVAAVVSVAVAVVLFFEKKKKDEEDLEHYLDCSIQ